MREGPASEEAGYNTAQRAISRCRRGDSEPGLALLLCGFLSFVSRSAGNDFRYRALVRGIARLSFVVVQNLPAIEIVFELTRPQAMCGWFFAWVGDVDNHQKETAGDHSSFGGLKEISLQVVTDGDQVPARAFNVEFTLFEVGDTRIHGQAARRSAVAQNLNGGLGGVHGGDAPAVLRQPERVPARPAGQVERPA
jgi:hypothetical protein